MDNETMSDGGDMGMAGGPEAGAELSQPEAAAPGEESQEAANTITIPAPMGQTVRSGDTLTFSVTSDPDESGNITGYWETPGDAEGSSSQSWEDDFRKEMSPRNPTETA